MARQSNYVRVKKVGNNTLLCLGTAAIRMDDIVSIFWSTPKNQALVITRHHGIVHTGMRSREALAKWLGLDVPPEAPTQPDPDPTLVHNGQQLTLPLPNDFVQVSDPPISLESPAPPTGPTKKLTVKPPKPIAMKIPDPSPGWSPRE